MKKETRADLALLLTAGFWGVGYYLLDLCLREMQPFTTTALRFLGAFVLLYLLLFKRLRRPSLSTILYSLLLGALMVFVYISASYGLLFTSQSNAGFLCALAVIFVPLINRVFLRQKLPRKMLAVLLLAFFGIALLTLKDSFIPSWGDLLCVLCSVAYAVHLVVTEQAVNRKKVNALQVGVYQMLFGGLINLALSLLFERPFTLPSSGTGVLSLVLLCLFCTVFAFVVQPIALQYTTASRAGVMFTAEPLVAAVVAYLFAGEVLKPWNYAGMAVLICALLLMELDVSTLFHGRKRRMKTNPLGKTGLTVPRVGFGGIPIQKLSREAMPALMDALQKSGVTYLDSARGYTVSEEWIGFGIAGRRDAFILATKSMARDASGMRRDIAQSLKNFGVDYIDLYQLHNPSADEIRLCCAPGGALEALTEAKAAGKIGHIGVTLHSLEAFAYAVTLPWVETVMFPYNLVETQGAALIDVCRAKGIGFIAMKPLAGGAIDSGTVALKYILQNPGVSVVIPGMADAKEIAENTAAACGDPAFTADEQAQADEYKKRLDGNFCRRCNYCQPCTAGINISFCFTLDGYYTRYGLMDWAKSRYRTLAVPPAACVDCGLCETRCPYHLPIRQMLKDCTAHFEEEAR